MGKIIKYFTLFHLLNNMTLQNYTFEIDRFTNVLSKSLFILERKNKVLRITRLMRLTMPDIKIPSTITYKAQE